MNIFSTDDHQQKISDGLKQLVILIITLCALFGPAVLLSAVLASYWPVYIVAGTDAVGAAIGTIQFHLASDSSTPGDDSTTALHGAPRSFIGKPLLNAH